MTPRQYLEKPQDEALKEHLLREITAPESPVRSFELTKPGQRSTVLLTFTPEGMVIQGSLGPSGSEGNGVLSARGCDLAWFCGNLSDDQVLDPFFGRKVYQVDVAEQDLIELSASSPDSKALCLMANDPGFLVEQGTVMKRLLDLGFSREAASEVGVDYPRGDATWIVAIRRRFLDLRQQVS